jgi:hypothetical protein
MADSEKNNIATMGLFFSTRSLDFALHLWTTLVSQVLSWSPLSRSIVQLYLSGPFSPSLAPAVWVLLLVSACNVASLLSLEVLNGLAARLQR